MLATGGVEDLSSDSASDLPERLARRVAAPPSRHRRETSAHGRIGAFELAMQSATSLEARAAVLDFVENGFLHPLSRTLGHTDSARAVLIVALLAGVDIMRSVVASHSATELESDWLQGAVADIIRYTTTLPPPPASDG